MNENRTMTTCKDSLQKVGNAENRERDQFRAPTKLMWEVLEGGPKCKDGMHGEPDCKGCRVHCVDVRKVGDHD